METRTKEVVETSWTEARLEDITKPDAKILYGILQPGPDIPDGVPYVRPTEMDKDEIILDQIRRTTPAIAAKYKRSLLEEGDVLLSIVGTIGKVAIVPKELEGGNITQSSVRIRAGSKLTSDFLAWYLRSPSAVKQYDAARLGTAVPRLNVAHVRDLVLPIPPLPEQRRIVEAIELQLGRLDAAVARLHAAKAKLKRYKQAVLKAAVEGRLFNDDLDENELPDGWEWTTLGDAVQLVSGGTPKGVNDATNEGTIPFFKVGDMTLDGNERYMETSRSYLTEKGAKQLKLTIYPAGTVIFPKRGGAILTNKKRVLSGPGAFDLNLMGALPSETIDSDFLYYWFEQLDLSKIYDGSNIPQINKKNVDPLPFVKPPITEQRRIADELDRLLDSTNEMETTLDAQLAQSTRLRQAVLKRAFEGRLV